MDPDFDDVTLADLAAQPMLLTTWVKTAPRLTDEPREEWLAELLERNAA